MVPFQQKLRLLIWPSVVWLGWVCLFALADLMKGQDALNDQIARPLEIKVRSWLGHPPTLDPRLKIFNLDDSSYAALGKPFLSASHWQTLLQEIGKSHPRAIVTTHMFGTGELTEEGQALAKTLMTLKNEGILVAAGAFAYPRRLSYRDPLPLDRDEFQVLNREDAEAPAPLVAADRLGWQLYGPDAKLAFHFSRIGHVGFEAGGRAPLFMRLSPDRVVPHLALSVLSKAELLQVAKNTELTRPDGLTQINFTDLSFYQKRAKSLSSLLRDAQKNIPSPYITSGDVVLVLTEMYSGKVNFVSTPMGLIPSGYVTAALLSSVLQNSWLKDSASGFMQRVLIGMLAAALGIFLAFFFGGNAFLCILISLTTCAVAAALWAFTQYNLLTPWLPITLQMSASGLTVFSIKLRRQIRGDRKQRQAAIQEAAKLQAVVRTSQMFAHDLRKPFSMLKTALKALSSETDARQTQVLLVRLLPELGRSMISVDRMLRDIMDIDGSVKPQLSACRVEDLVGESLQQLFAAYSDVPVIVRYDLRHHLSLLADSGKIQRVLMNIFENAVQAIKSGEGQGELCITTRDIIDDARAFIELRLSNSGSSIDSKHLPHIFEAFYTFGKKDGTGLGLAIAYKIVVEHGGSIGCESSETSGTTFIIRLPVAYETPRAPELTDALPVGTAAALLRGDHRQGILKEAKAADHRANAALEAKKEPWLAIVDDSPFILEAWKILIKDARLFVFATPSDFWKMTKETPAFLLQLDCIVTDYYFEADSQGFEEDGLSFAAKVKAQSDIPIFLASDALHLSQKPEFIDARIGKEPVSYAALLSHLPRTS